MSLFELRRNDYSLDDDMLAVRDLFEDFFASECPTSRVRAAEPVGFDAALWKSLINIGVVGMGLPESIGGDGVGLATLGLVAEQHGARLAPVPLIGQLATTRLLARVAGDRPEVREVIEAVAAGERFVALARGPVRSGARQLLVDGALATAVVAVQDGDLALFLSDAPGHHVKNQASAPLAWWSDDQASTRIPLGPVTETLDRARDEVRLLTSAALVGMTRISLEIACEFVRTRFTMGVPIGSLQGVSFPLTDVAINLDGAGNLVRKAAWLTDEAHGEAAGSGEKINVAHQLSLAAFAAAARTATHGTTTSAHMQGGLGFTVEADASLYFLRSKGWIEFAGNPDADLAELGRLRLASAVPVPNHSA